MTEPTAEDIKRINAQMKNQLKHYNQIRRDSPGTPELTAMVMAGDLAHADQVEREILTPDSTPDDKRKAVQLVGSYARIEFAIKHLTEDQLLEDWPQLWVGSDPDDTDPRYLDIWTRRSQRYGVTLDNAEAALNWQRWRRARDWTLTVYRGQAADAPLGISWTTDVKIAAKFAAGAGQRCPLQNGTIIVRRIPLSSILAVLHARGESELIVELGAAGLT